MDAWKSDGEYEDKTLVEVELHPERASVTYDDGWSQSIPTDQHIPEEGMRVRCFGEGIGRPVRGVVDLDSGTPFYYRTKEEQQEHMATQLYGADAEEWLERWDDGQAVWSIEMGGIGPGYEQAIQITVVEILRHLIDRGYDSSAWSDSGTWDSDLEVIEEAVLDASPVENLGLSGAQWGAALSLARAFYIHGPRDVLGRDDMRDRKIQVRKGFPRGGTDGA